MKMQAQALMAPFFFLFWVRISGFRQLHLPGQRSYSFFANKHASSLDGNSFSNINNNIPLLFTNKRSRSVGASFSTVDEGDKTILEFDDLSFLNAREEPNVMLEDGLPIAKILEGAAAIDELRGTPENDTSSTANILRSKLKETIQEMAKVLEQESLDLIEEEEILPWGGEPWEVDPDGEGHEGNDEKTGKELRSKLRSILESKEVQEAMEPEPFHAFPEETLEAWAAQAPALRNSSAFGHLQLSHQIWDEILRPGDIIIDATCGKGQDTIRLVRAVMGWGSVRNPGDWAGGNNGGVLDAQNDDAEASAASRGVTLATPRGEAEGVVNQDNQDSERGATARRRPHVYALDIQEDAIAATRHNLEAALGPAALRHVTLVQGSHERFPAQIQPGSARLVVYNLGYLPGFQAKHVTTAASSTRRSLAAAANLVGRGGLISVMAYRMHAGGLAEAAAVRAFARRLDPREWRVFVHEPANQPAAPLLVTMLRG